MWGLSNVKLRSKVILLALIPTLILAVALSAVSIAVLYRLAHEEVDQARQLLLKERGASLEHHVQMAVSSVKTIYDESANGDLAARNRAVQVLRKLTYDKQGYFFGYDRENIRLFWADKDIDIGVSFNDVKDANGVFAIRELNLLAHAGKHFLRYDWAVPGNDKPIPKLGYSVLFEKWDMMIATSVNLDDIDAEVDRIVIADLVLLVIAVVAVLLCCCVAVLLGNSIIKPLLVTARSIIKMHWPLLGKARWFVSFRWCLVLIWSAPSRKAATLTSKWATTCCSMAGEWAKHIGVALLKRRA